MQYVERERDFSTAKRFFYSASLLGHAELGEVSLFFFNQPTNQPTPLLIDRTALKLPSFFFTVQIIYVYTYIHTPPYTIENSKRGGGGVNMEEYARRMSSGRCDGDHITLQALCDALKVGAIGSRERRGGGGIGWEGGGGAAEGLIRTDKRCF